MLKWCQSSRHHLLQTSGKTIGQASLLDDPCSSAALLVLLDFS